MEVVKGFTLMKLGSISSVLCVVVTSVFFCSCGTKEKSLRELPNKKTGDHKVVFVNVSGAIPGAILDKSVDEIQTTLRVNSSIINMQSIDPRDLVLDWARVSKKYGFDACLVIFVINDLSGMGFLNKPGMWSVISVRQLRTDNPSEELYGKRVYRMLMKGLGLAAGVGGNPDPHCVMYYKSFSLQGIDYTSATFGPFALSPIQDTLRMIGGDEIFLQDANRN